MATCPTCANENPDRARFCNECGASLAALPPVTEERKVVTTLFCDLVGSTALGEDADPEDIDGLLRRYNELARRIVENYGGTVEKFIGDAVVGVFGVPVVHEDDPERAVRAALKLVSAVEDLPPIAGHLIQVRVGVNTGEALVRLDVTPGSGARFLTGDAVNVGARLQAAAPPMGVVVGALTHELTRKAIVYEVAEPVIAKGKREPLEAWLAREPVARTGAQAVDWNSPFVGRAVELGYLSALLDKAADSCAPQVAVIVGEAGIGKSRLVGELYARVEASTRLVTWRQGRCLSYGEGVAFWAIAEIVKGHAGIREGDDVGAVEAKLEQVLPEGDDRSWFRQRLRALLGMEAAQAEREENFTAWLRFLEEVASLRPTILVFEDLHWADDALLDFLEFAARNVAHVPLMIVATARPELFERHPSFAATTRVNRIALEPLSEGEMKRLVASVVAEPAAGLQDAIVLQAQGNPFYAEESARLVVEHATGGVQASPLAGTVQAVIAARLDALAPELKALVADAAVAGEVFWDGLLARMGERASDEVTDALDRLVARQLVYRVHTSSMAGEREYRFGHSLTREVAYSGMPRLRRAKRHQAVAGWIQVKTGERSDELAEILAHHYLAALDLAREAGGTLLEAELRAPAIECLTDASARVLAVDVEAAERYCAQALALTEGSDRPSDLLCAWASVLSLTERHRESVAVWRQAIERLRREGRGTRAALAICDMGFACETLGMPSWELVDEALDLVGDDGPSAELARVQATALARDWATKTRSLQEVVEGADEILAMCREADLAPPPPVFNLRAMARILLGDEGGMEDFQRGLAVAESQGLAVDEEVFRYNAAYNTMEFKGAAAALDALLRGLAAAQRRGSSSFVRSYEAALVFQRYHAGQWDEALEVARAAEPRLVEAEDNWDLFTVQSTRVLILTAMGRVEEADRYRRWTSEHRLQALEPWDAMMRCVTAIAVSSAREEWDEVGRLLPELKEYSVALRTEVSTSLVRWALSAQKVEEAKQLGDAIEPLTPLRAHVRCTCSALLEESDGQYEAAATGFAEAAARWRRFAIPFEEAQASLGQGRCLLALRRPREAAPCLERAREIFERLHAKPALAETEELLARASAVR